LKGQNVKKSILSAIFILLMGVSIPAFAQEAADPAYLSLGAGIWDITQDDDMATDLRVEYRHDKPLFWKIKPWSGLEATTDGSIWGGAGVLADFKPAENIYITPSFGVGLYTEGSSDKDLDYPIEFRSQLEGGYQFMNGHRVGVAFGHISNADLGDDNPGTEILNVYYHMPINSMF
jgi:lipid A 3-O-deacylase